MNSSEKWDFVGSEAREQAIYVRSGSYQDDFIDLEITVHPPRRGRYTVWMYLVKSDQVDRVFVNSYLKDTEGYGLALLKTNEPFGLGSQPFAFIATEALLSGQFEVEIMAHLKEGGSLYIIQFDRDLLSSLPNRKFLLVEEA